MQPNEYTYALSICLHVNMRMSVNQQALPLSLYFIINFIISSKEISKTQKSEGYKYNQNKIKRWRREQIIDDMTLVRKHEHYFHCTNSFRKFRKR